MRTGQRAASHFVRTIFCWLPPDSAATGVSSRGDLTRSRSKKGCATCRSPPRVMKPSRGEGGQDRQGGVVEHVHREHEPLPLAVFRDEADAERDGLCRVH